MPAESGHHEQGRKAGQRLSLRTAPDYLIHRALAGTRERRWSLTNPRHRRTLAGNEAYPDGRPPGAEPREMTSPRDETSHRWGGRDELEVARSFAGISDKLFVADKGSRGRVEGHFQYQPASAERDGGDVMGGPARQGAGHPGHAQFRGGARELGGLFARNCGQRRFATRRTAPPS